ncbi:hypothetical protein Tco_1125944 [Tanacetum coccineum]
MGVAVENSKVDLAAYNISFMTLKHPFTYLGVKVGGRITRINSWDEIINKNPLSALEVEDEDSLYWWKLQGLRPCPTPLPESPTREFEITTHQTPSIDGEASQRRLPFIRC